METASASPPGAAAAARVRPVAFIQPNHAGSRLVAIPAGRRAASVPRQSLSSRRSVA